jgi:hypothetical protein
MQNKKKDEQTLFTIIISILLLVIAIGEPIINTFTNLFTFEQSMQVMVGLLCTGLITYILAESSREKDYQKRIIDVITEIHEIGKSITPFRTVSMVERYKIGTDIAKEATERVVLFAGSLILLTGPKPYLETKTIEYESEQDELLNNLAQSASNGKKPRILCAFSPNRLLNEMETITQNHKSKRFLNAVINRLSTVEAYHRKKNSSFEMRQTKSEGDNPYFIFIVGDDRFALWLKNAVTKGHDLCITGKDQGMADNLAWLFMELTEEVNYHNLSYILQQSAEKGLLN